MRDIGFDFYWNDPYSKNLVARGFEYGQDTGKIELITSFECLEHLPNPLESIEEMLDITDNLLVSTRLLPFPIPNVNEWSYYATVHGQHISFYSRKTLEFIAAKYDLT